MIHKATGKPVVENVVSIKRPQRQDKPSAFQVEMGVKAKIQNRVTLHIPDRMATVFANILQKMQCDNPAIFALAKTIEKAPRFVNVDIDPTLVDEIGQRLQIYLESVKSCNSDLRAFAKNLQYDLVDAEVNETEENDDG